MKLLLENWKRFLNEGRLDKETTLISNYVNKKLIEFINSNDQEKNEEVNKIQYYANISNLDYFWVYFKKKNQSNFSIYGSMNSFSRGMINSVVINVDLPLDVKERKDIWKEIIFRIKETIRHELEHTQQDVTQGTYKNNIKTVDGLIEYYTNPLEVEAFVSGLYKIAKSRKQSLMNTINSKLSMIYDRVLNATSSSEDTKKVIDKIREKWVEFGRMRFPSANMEPYGIHPKAMKKVNQMGRKYKRNKEI